MRRFLLSVLVILAVGMAKADEKAWYLTTDTNVSVPMENVDYLLAADDDDHFTVVVKSGDPVAYVKVVKFSQSPTGIENVNASKEKVALPTKAKNWLQLSGMKAGTEVAIYSVDGRLIKKATATSDALTISVEDLAKGTYVLRTKNSDVKFIKQ